MRFSRKPPRSARPRPQESGSGLYIAADWQGRIIGTRQPHSSNAEFFWFADGSSSAASNDKYAEFAPGGVASNKVMAEVRGHVGPAPASGAANQKWGLRRKHQRMDERRDRGRAQGHL